MNLKKLLQQYREDRRTQTVLNELTKTSRVQLKNLVGTQLGFVLQAINQSTHRPILFVAMDKEEAAYLQNDLATLTKKEKSLFFPDSFRRPMGFDKLNRSAVLQRTETIAKMVEFPKLAPVIITYPEALFEKVVAPAHLKKHVIQLKVGASLDVPFLVEILVDYGFEHVDFVYEPGQFSARGAIVDIYSYGNEEPYRVELFDDEVESIRTFNPTSQLSTKKMAFVNIIPNVNTQFESKDKVSVLEVLPEHTFVAVKDFQHLLDCLQNCFDKANAYDPDMEQLVAEARKEESELLKERAFLSPSEVIAAINNRPILEFSTVSFFKDIFCMDYSSQPQPSFNKNFQLLIKELKSNTERQITNVVFAENPKQIERFYSIFEDLGVSVSWHPIPKAVHQGFIDFHQKVACYTDHQIFDRYHRYKTRKGFDQRAALRARTLNELKPGDYITHIDYGVGKYAGLAKITIMEKEQEALKLVYQGGDLLYVSVHSLHKISKYVAKDEDPPKMHKLGSQVWANTKKKTKKKIKELAFDLIKLYAKRRATKGFAFPEDGYLQNELEASFTYEDTPDQAKATEDVKADMMKAYPMDRLICGDVGFGKTEIAIRAAFKAVVAGKQVAVLVPTTILALQHAQTFRKRLNRFGLTVEYINRFRKAKEKAVIYKQLKAGAIDILIGTHAILNKKIEFKDLGLLITDEEQKFGVSSKEKIRNRKVNVDTLTLTATPIPRTLQFSLLGARDLSIINTPPPNRQPIYTEVRTFNNRFIKEVIEKEVARGGQVFFLHNRVESLNDMATMLQSFCPSIDIAVAHGKMDANKLERTLLDFMKGYYEVLCCTNIVETGLDIANANTIIINNAHHFGLSDLHQLRGRVGRSNKKAYCYLLAPPASTMPPESRKRLKTIEEFSELGSGFNIALKDLDIRGAGNMLGAEQSGFIVNMGYETYQKILVETIQELKENEYKGLFKEELEQQNDFVKEVNIESDLDIFIPNEYVSSIEERLVLYQKLDKLKTEEDTAKYAKELTDRFGKLPQAVVNLLEAIRIRWVAKKLGFERILLRKRKLKCYFIANQQSPFFESTHFHRVLQYIKSQRNRQFGLKQTSNHLIFTCDEIPNLLYAKRLLKEIEKKVTELAVV